MSSLRHTFSWNKHLKIKREINSCGNVFYYTTTDTFKKIIESGCIFASHIKYMNDWQEFDNGYECIRTKIIDRLEFLLKGNSLEDRHRRNIQDIISFFKQDSPRGYRCMAWTDQKKEMYEFGRKFQFYDYAFPQVYSISFTEKRDLLSQWKMYARESGIAVEFDFEKNNVFSQKVSDEYVFREETFPQKVIYQNKTEFDEIELLGLDDEVINTEDVIRNLEKIPFIKSPYYSAEGEYRVVFRPYTDDSNFVDNKKVDSEVKFRESGHVLIPYLEIYCLDKTHKKISWPIVSLTIGPGNNQDIVYSSMIYFVENISQNIYDFTIGEYIDNFERYYNILIKKLKKEIWKGKGDIIISNIIKEFRESCKQENRISKYYSNGKFKAEMQRAINAIYEVLQREMEEENKDKGMQIIKQFEVDHYLTSNGIIIQKSKAPYIFN